VKFSQLIAIINKEQNSDISETGVPDGRDRKHFETSEFYSALIQLTALTFCPIRTMSQRRIGGRWAQLFTF